MRINDEKVLYLCNTCNNWFYELPKEFAECNECGKSVKPINNTFDRHREECSKCHSVFEIQKKSPYDNSHYLNCDNCMTVMKINYSDSILQKYSNDLGLFTKDINSREINSYNQEIESHLNKCLCDGNFSFYNPKKCPFCMEDIKEISNNYLTVNVKNKVTIPILSKHIWKKNLDVIVDLGMTGIKEANIFAFLKLGKFLQEKHYEFKGFFAQSLAILKKEEKLKEFFKLYSFNEKEKELESIFDVHFEVFEDDFHFILSAKKQNEESYLIKGKTGEIEIHKI